MGMRKIRRFIIAAFAVLLVTACNADVLTTPPSDYEGSSGRPSTKAFFTGAAPADVMATQAFYTDKIALVFNVVPGADFYEIYKAEVPRALEDVNVMSLDWKKLDYDVEPFRETDRVVIWNDMIPQKDRANYRYFYKVRAGSNINYSNNVQEGAFSDIVEGWTLIPPASLTASQGDELDRITLNWTGDDHVQGYLVYMLDSATSKWNIVNDGLFSAPAKGVKDYAFDYYVDPVNYGNTLYFRLGSVSLGNNPSDMGVIRSGYTFVKGAPEKPRNLKVSQADFINKVEISWEKPTDDKRKPGFNWKVVRYTDDTPEAEVVTFNAYDITNPDKMPDGLKIVKNPDTNKDTYVFTDTFENGVAPGVVYHYKVMASAEIDKDGEMIWVPGKADVKDGAVCAPPKNIAIDVSFPSDAPDGRFSFRIPTPFGYMIPGEEEHSKGWKYNIYGRYNNGVDTPENYELVVSDVDVEETETLITYDYSVMNRKNEFVVSIKNTLGESKNTGDLYKIVLSADKVMVDDIVFKSNSYRDGLTASSDGVYPVVLDVNNADAFKKLFISVNGGEAKEISMSKLKSTAFAVESPQKPFETYEYTVYGESLFGRRTKVSKPVTAYGAITPEKFIKLFEAYAMKPWEFVGKAGFPAELNTKWTTGDAGKLNSMIASHGLDALGSMNVASNCHGGSLSYSSVKGDGFAGNVYFSFKNFGEVEGMWSNGSYEMINVSTSGNGDVVNGTIKVDGMYPAVVDFSHLKVNGYGFAGDYKVAFKNELGTQSVTATKN